MHKTQIRHSSSMRRSATTQEANDTHTWGAPFVTRPCTHSCMGEHMASRMLSLPPCTTMQVGMFLLFYRLFSLISMQLS